MGSFYRAVIAVFPVILFTSCLAVPANVRLPLVNEGEIHLYLQLFPQEADRLSFTLGGIAALRDDGQEVPLTLLLPVFEKGEVRRQRLLCEGVLPPGPYAGFTIQVAKASLRGEEGDAQLLVPDKPVRIDFPFRIEERKASVLFMGFNVERSLSDEVSFSPAFSLFPPPKPVTAVLGYIADSASHALTVFDKNAVLAVGDIATGRGPRGVVLDQQQKRVYAAISGDDTIEVIDMTTQGPVRNIRLNLGDGPQGLALVPDGRTLLSVNAGSNTVSIIDTGLLVETARIPVGNGPGAVLLDRTGRRAYVFNTLSDSVSVIDIANRALVTSFTTDPEPRWGQFHARGDRLYIICRRSPYMTVLDPVTLSVLSRVYVGMGMEALKVDTVTDLIYAGRGSDARVEIYDPVSLVAFDYIDTGEGPAYLTIDGEGNNLWIVGGRTRTLIVVNLASKKVVSEIDVGEGPFWLAMMGER